MVHSTEISSSPTSNYPQVKDYDLIPTKAFGRVRRISLMPEEDGQDNPQDQPTTTTTEAASTTSFVGTMGVPTFATIEPTNHMVVNDGNDTVGSSNADHIKQTPSSITPTTMTATRKRGLEGVFGQYDHQPAFVVDGILSDHTCESIITDCETTLGGFGNFDSGRNHHGAMQVVVTRAMADSVAQRLAPHINVDQVNLLRQQMIRKTSYNINEDDNDDDDTVRLFFAGLNRRWRIYRYLPSGNETFAPHIDASFPPSGLSNNGRSLVWDDSKAHNSAKIVSRLTVLMYLSDDFVGGETNFYLPLAHDEKIPGSSTSPLPVIASVRPMKGSVLLFPQGVGEEEVEYARRHWPLHEGSPVVAGNPKYVIRSDALFVEEKDEPPFEDANMNLFQYDHLVRKTFLPKSTVWDPAFLSHANLLYNPHMGVENLGPFLYSFIRFTKVQRVCEIGAGYTSLWILQALKDNDEDMRDVQNLQTEGKCRMLDIDWSISTEVNAFNSRQSRLLCIDNCEHQKETATGARAVAKTLGLSNYFEFLQGDAYDLDLGTEAVDMLWCDFGVGSRMKDFIMSAWKSIRPGGFLICHSSLTNENTQLWLESVRSRQPMEITGIPPDEYVELSLLEPHKRFQNSISILQKRRNEAGKIFEEPIYSQYA